MSSCGSHLVALLRRSRLLVLYDFERVVRGEIELNDAMVDVELGPSYYCSRYLAFENNRVAVATVRSFHTLSTKPQIYIWRQIQGYGVFVLSIQPTPDPLEVTEDPQPSDPSSRALPGRVSVCLALRFNDHPFLRRISCLQMTDTGLYLNWEPNDPLLSDSIQENYYHSLMASIRASSTGELQVLLCT